jgi:hypothetical protein
MQAVSIATTLRNESYIKYIDEDLAKGEYKCCRSRKTTNDFYGSSNLRTNVALSALNKGLAPPAICTGSRAAWSYGWVT